MLNKAIEHGKEKRKDYSNKESRRYGRYVLNDFSHNPETETPWERDNRLHKNRKRDAASKAQMTEIEE